MSGLRCEWCATPADPGSTGCRTCGGPVDVLEPWVIDCGWCASPNRRDITSSCHRCGGPLPTIPGAHPGPRPPEVPRSLPPDYPWRVRLWKNVETIIGIVFTVVFCWTVLFPVLGVVLWIRGHRRAEAILDALVMGTATRGRILAVAVDDTVSINDRHPWRIDFEYDTPAGPRKGFAQAWDPANARRPVGEHLWVLYRPLDPDAHALWPPIR